MREFSPEIKDVFHSIYKNDINNLKAVTIEMQKRGLSYIELLQLTTQELKIDLGKAIYYLEIPDYIG